MSMRHSISVGGRFRPPPKYWSYSTLSCRISFSSVANSSSMVAMSGRFPQTSMLGARSKTVNRMYSSSRLVTLCLFRFAFPLEQEFLGSKISQGLVRAHTVVSIFPDSQLLVKRRQAWLAVGQFVEFFVMRAIGPLHMAVQFRRPRRQHE